MSATPPFLPEPEPAPRAPVAPKNSGVKRLALWVVLVVMFLAIWQFLAPDPKKPSGPPLPACEPSPMWLTVLPYVVVFGLLFLLLRRFYRSYGESLEFNVAQEAGRLALAERRFGAAFDVFRRNEAAYAKKPPYAVAVALALGNAQLFAGNLEDAAATLAKVERSRFVLFSSATRTMAAVHLAFVQALSGQLDAAERWCAEARARITKNKDDRLDYAARLCLAEAVVALRRGRSAEASALMTENWNTMREVLNGNTMRAAEVLRAFAEAAGGVRASNTVAERLVRVEPVVPGEFAFLGVGWPEMRAFLAAHHLDAPAGG
jgi:hypothetical protein